MAASTTPGTRLTAPFREPDRLTHADRKVSARWNLGAPDGQGWQPQAVLSVHHVIGRGYRATLNTILVRTTQGRPEEDIDPLRAVLIHDVSTAGRYSRAGLCAAYEAALAQLRGRVAAADTAVQAHLPADTAPAGDEPRNPRSPQAIVPSVVDNLVDGDVFSVDGGCVWYVCAVLGFGTVSVYTTPQRDDESPTIRIEADRDDPCLLLIA